MFHLLFGEPPSFRGGRGADPALARERSGTDAVADQVASIIERCLSENPGERPAANECFLLLSAVADSGPTPPAATRGPSPTAARRKERAAREDDTAERQDRTPRPAAGDPAVTSGPRDVSEPNPLPQTSNERWWQ
jgi:hypothetical protein